MQQVIKEFETLTEVLDDLDALGVQGLQRYRAMSHYLSIKASQRDIPIYGTFELTPFCNLNCKMCYVHLNQNQIGKNERLLTVDEWKFIIKQAVDAGLMYATLTGGECLTYPGFKDLYLYLIDLGIQPDIMTNGRLLTEEMVAFLAQNPPGFMQISLYGSNEDAYENVTCNRAFQEVMDGMERAKKAGLNITIGITPNRYMQDDIEDLLNLLYSLNLPYTIGSSTLSARPETERDFLDFEIDIDAFFRLKHLNEEHIASLPKDSSKRSVPVYMPPNLKKLKGLPCGGAHSSYHVNWKGELCPCIAFSATVHTSILQTGFKAAWNEITHTMQAYTPLKECLSCNVKDKCQACPGEKCMSDLNGSLNTSVCEKIKRNISEEH